jgi:DNA-binding transcriptional LysR family regulator
MDFKRLRYALAVADAGNFVRAAELVSISQPALSRAIQTLEDELGIVLFDRGNRNVTVTTAGRAFIEHARRICFEVSNMEHDVDQLRSGNSGLIAFGVGPLHTAALLPRLLARLRAERPAVRLSVVVNNWMNLLTNLRAEEIEFFMAEVRSIEPADDIIITHEVRQFGSLFCRPGHPLLDQQEHRLQDVMPYGLACPRLPLRIENALRQIFKRPPGKPLPLALQCDSMSVLFDAVQSTNAVLMASDAAVAPELESGRLIPIHVKEMAQIYAEVGIVYLRGRTLSPGAQLAITDLRAVLAGLPATEVLPSA